MENQKYCKHCGQLIDKDCVICVHCGKQVEELRHDNDKNIIINNNNNSSSSSSASAAAINTGIMYGKAKNKWVTFFLCLFGGFLGLHKFYEGKIGMGILYLFTGGLFFVGIIIDIIAILGKSNPYYV